MPIEIWSTKTKSPKVVMPSIFNCFNLVSLNANQNEAAPQPKPFGEGGGLAIISTTHL